MIDDDALEAAARALWCSEFDADPEAWPLVCDGTREEFRGKARTAIEAYEAERWRPIETAVNDGQILAFVPSYYCGRGGIIVATWVDHREPGCGWYDNQAWLVEPTHWMPLPFPPSTTERTDDA